MDTKLERAAETLERRLGPTLDRAADAYDRFVAPAREVAKGMAGALGGPVGAAVAAGIEDVLGARGAILREQRLVALMREMHEALKAVDASKLDLAFLGSLEWSALLEGGMLKAMRAWQEEKVRIFAQFLANATKIGPSPGYRERMLSVVDSLTLGHIFILRRIVSWTTPPKRFDVIYPSTEFLTQPMHLGTYFPDMETHEVLGYVADVTSRGLALAPTNLPTRDAIDRTGTPVQFPWVVATIQGFEVMAFIGGPETPPPVVTNP